MLCMILLQFNAWFVSVCLAGCWQCGSKAWKAGY
jgi:hypothetical protein